jgi:hypothetical protein
MYHKRAALSREECMNDSNASKGGGIRMMKLLFVRETQNTLRSTAFFFFAKISQISHPGV